ncbi:ATP-binding cassette domain-containing protein [Nocardioides sp. B-3]|nr:ATP-binding cassette domain-containing protein [Nocardioides sp. B-3]UUZ59046.1 ATP-binding cassette domain-containing protein [Nocardioides sp. B-3]
MPNPGGNHGAPRVLRSTGLSVAFDGIRALQGIDLELRHGEILGLIGPNGAGKSTMTNALTGFAQFSGQLEVDGHDVTGWSSHRLARFGVRRSFRAVRLFQGMSVRENVEVAALGCGMAPAAASRAAADALEAFGLLDHADSPAGAMPYGHERRLGIARAVVAQPRYLLLDEPAAGLNEEESDLLLSQLRVVPQHFDCGVLLIEHDMRLVMGLCHRIHVIDHGRTLVVGTPRRSSLRPGRH